MVTETVTALEQRGREKAEAFGIWPQNWEAVKRFLTVATQWRVAAGFGGLVWIGLDYGAAKAVLEAKEPMSQEHWQDLRVMEAGALHVLNGKSVESLT